MEFGKIKSVPLKEIWVGEATHFTPWLGDNISSLSQALGMDLVLETLEKSAGDFSADIVARDLSSSRTVVIENQFGSTDHRHLGQIITYSSVLGAGIVIWIAESIRSEHRSAINYLNQNLKDGLQLFAVEISVIRIDDSRPAYIFDVVCSPPTEWINAAVAGNDPSETSGRYRSFFQALIDDLRNIHRFTNARAGQPQNWYTFSSENSKIFKYSSSFASGGRVRAEIYIDAGEKSANEAIFDYLDHLKDEIGRDFGEALIWEKLDNKRACRIACYRDGSIDQDSEALADIRKWLIDRLLRLKAVFPKRFETALRDLGLN